MTKEHKWKSTGFDSRLCRLAAKVDYDDIGTLPCYFLPNVPIISFAISDLHDAPNLRLSWHPVQRVVVEAMMQRPELKTRPLHGCLHRPRAEAADPMATTAQLCAQSEHRGHRATAVP
jgi:hypothetical protein